MLLRAAVLLVGVASSVLPVRAADDLSPQWKYDNPFCGVIASVAPIPDVVASLGPIPTGSRYVLGLFTRAGTTLAAHVTLVGDSDAYDAAVPDTNLFGTAQDRQVPAVIVTLPARAQIRYFFVDSYTLDRSAAVTCPSYVFPVGEAQSSAPAGLQTIAAEHLQTLDPHKCDRMYVEPEMRGDLQSPVGRYGGKPLTVVARAYIDSNGYSLKEDIVRSSGVDGFDKFMLGAVGVHQFLPARFLCVPVVGIVDVELKYFP